MILLYIFKEENYDITTSSYFVSVYEHKSITKAANTLHIAQPSVSLAIKELGEYYGVQLFDRIGRGITPTEAAKHLYGYAIHIVSLFNEMEQHIKTGTISGLYVLGQASQLVLIFFLN